MRRARGLHPRLFKWHPFGMAKDGAIPGPPRNSVKKRIHVGLGFMVARHALERMEVLQEADLLEAGRHGPTGAGRQVNQAGILTSTS